MNAIGLQSNPNGPEPAYHDNAIVAAADALAASPTFIAECMDNSPELPVIALAAASAQAAYDRADFADDAFDNLRRLVRMYEASDAAIAGNVAAQNEAWGEAA